MSGSWDVFLWGGQAPSEHVSGNGGWRQASLAGPPRDGATLLVVFGLGARGDEFEMRLFDPATWRLLAWCKDRLPPSEFVVDRDNFGVQLRCVTALATLAGPPPSGVKLRDAGWTSLSACGWEWDSILGPSATPRWSRLTSDNTVGPSSYPSGTAAADIHLPDVTLSLGG